MASKRTKAAPADDEFGDLFEGIGDDKAVKKSAKPKTSAAKGKSDGSGQDDILAELENQLVDEKPSRPHTPRIREPGPKGSPAKRTSTNTPPPPSDEKNLGLARKSAESTRSYHASFTPSATSSELHDAEKRATADVATAAAGDGGGGWWGSVLASASAAMKQAEAAVKEIQQNEEAKRWAEQVRGNVGSLKGFGNSTPLPSFLPCFFPSDTVKLCKQEEPNDFRPSR